MKTPPVVAKETFKGTEQKPEASFFHVSECHTDYSMCTLCVFVGRSRLEGNWSVRLCSKSMELDTEILRRLTVLCSEFICVASKTQ